jgi:sugar O-acyltransferase (sialic acid O-acetyltransferase NeuD family)
VAPVPRPTPGPRSLLLVGAGGFGREAAEVVRAVNARQPQWDLLGFLDDMTSLQGGEVDGIPVLGPADAVHEYPDAQLAVCAGRPDNYFSRKRLVRRMELPGARYATIVHPAAVIPAGARLGPGTVVLAGVVLTTSISVGSHVAVMPGVILTHDDLVCDYVTLASGARLGGGVRVGEGAYIGAGAHVRGEITIGPWALVGMGSVVVRDVPAGEVWAGVPARRLRSLDVPEDIRAPT